MAFRKFPRLGLGLMLSLISGRALAVELDWLTTLGLTSNYVHRGITQSSDEPAGQLGASLRVPQGFYAGVWGSTIDTSHLGPDFGDGDGFEIDGLLGVSRPFDADWDWNLNVGRYSYVATGRNLRYDYTEVSAGIGWRERVRLNLSWSPDSTDHTRQQTALRGARYVAEVATEWPLTGWLSATGGLGYNDAKEVSDLRYVYYSAGLNLRWRRYALGLTYYGTDHEAHSRWSDGRADNRVVVNIAAVFSGNTTIRP